MAVDAETHFSAEILGRPADNETELLHLYAGILGQSMDLSANRLSLMGSLTPEGLAHAMHVLQAGSEAPGVGRRDLCPYARLAGHFQ